MIFSFCGPSLVLAPAEIEALFLYDFHILILRR